MPPPLESQTRTLPATLNLAFRSNDPDIDQEGAERFENSLKDNANKTDVEACVRFQMTIYEIYSWNDDTLLEYYREDFACVYVNQIKMLNGDLRRKF